MMQCVFGYIILGYIKQKLLCIALCGEEPALFWYPKGKISFQTVFAKQQVLQQLHNARGNWRNQFPFVSVIMIY